MLGLNTPWSRHVAVEPCGTGLHSGVARGRCRWQGHKLVARIEQTMSLAASVTRMTSVEDEERRDDEVGIGALR